jgi:hypothetical protein
MQHKPNVVDAPTNTLADPLNRLRQARAKHGIEVPDPRTDTQTTRPPDLSDASGSLRTKHEARNKPLSGKGEEANAIAEIQRCSVNRAIVIAIGQAKRIQIKEHDPEIKAEDIISIEDGFDTYGKQWRPGAGHQRGLRFVQFLFHSPHFADCRGNGAMLVQRLVANRAIMECCNKLGCEADDLMLAGDRVKLLAGQTLFDAVADRMGRVWLPERAIVAMEGMPVVQGLVRMLATLAELNNTTDVFLAGSDAARVLRVDPGSARRSLQLAVRLGIIVGVEKGHRRKGQVKGQASTYRVPWFTPTNGG